MYNKEDIRNFYLENEKGDRIDCQEENGNLFLYDIEGLGYEEDNEYEQVGNFSINSKKTIKQGTISGRIEFYDTAYDEYATFINFILKTSKLKLVYIPKKTERIEYYRDIDVTYIGKSEEDDFNILASEVTFTCKTLWYTSQNTIYTGSNNTTITHRVINDGHVPAGFKLTMKGAYNTNLNIQVIDLYNNILASMNFTINIASTEKFLYSSVDNDLFIQKLASNGTKTNLLDNSQIYVNLDNFFQIPVGEYNIKLTGSNIITEEILEVFRYYKTV